MFARLTDRSFAFLLSVAIVLAASCSEPASSESTSNNLLEEIARIDAATDANIGVSAIHLESGRSFELNGDDRFPMASTYKVGIAIKVLHMVEKGELSLDQQVEIPLWLVRIPFYNHLGASSANGATVPLITLLEQMIIGSDNTATDVLFDLIGGPEAVTAHLREIGNTGTSIDRTVVDLLADYLDVNELPDAEEWTADLQNELFPLARFLHPDQDENIARYVAIEKDKTTPLAMTDLLAGIWQGRYVNEEHSKLLQEIMQRTETGPDRIKGHLPAGTMVAHKTGTIGGVLNDVGIITLPGDAGHVALSVYVSGPRIDYEGSAKSIAHISRTIYDYFLYSGSDAAQQRLLQEIDRVAAAGGPGTTGLAAIHVESGEELTVNPDDIFLMASTFKVPIAIATLNMVEGGELSLDQLVTMEKYHYMVPDYQPMAHLTRHGGGQVSLQVLIDLMLIKSDNTATDAVLRTIGGPEVVTNYLRSIGVDDLTLNNSVTTLATKHYDLPYPANETDFSADWLEAEMRRLAAEASGAKEKPPVSNYQRYLRSEEDSGTTVAMSELLVRLRQGELLDEEHTALMFSIMRRCETGLNRIRGLLPSGVDVADKTGTIGGTVNNTAVITLPGDMGHLALTVYTKSYGDDNVPVEKIIAETSRSVYDYFLFSGAIQ